MSLKTNRAKRLANHLPTAERAIWSSISPTLIDTLTAAQLAEVARCLNAHWHKATAHASAEIVADGYVWSPEHAALLELSAPSRQPVSV